MYYLYFAMYIYYITMCVYIYILHTVYVLGWQMFLPHVPYKARSHHPTQEHLNISKKTNNKHAKQFAWSHKKGYSETKACSRSLCPTS